MTSVHLKEHLEMTFVIDADLKLFLPSIFAWKGTLKCHVGRVNFECVQAWVEILPLPLSSCALGQWYSLSKPSLLVGSIGSDEKRTYPALCLAPVLPNSHWISFVSVFSSLHLVRATLNCSRKTNTCSPLERYSRREVILSLPRISAAFFLGVSSLTLT